MAAWFESGRVYTLVRVLCGGVNRSFFSAQGPYVFIPVRQKLPDLVLYAHTPRVPGQASVAEREIFFLPPQIGLLYLPTGRLCLT